MKSKYQILTFIISTISLITSFLFLFSLIFQNSSLKKLLYSNEFKNNQIINDLISLNNVYFIILIVLVISLLVLIIITYFFQKKNYSKIFASETDLQSQQKFEELLNLNQLFSAITNNTIIYELNQKGNFIEANTEFLRTIGKAKKDIVGKKHKSIINKDFFDNEEYEMMWENFKGALPYTLKINYIFNEKNIWLSETYYPILEKNKIAKIFVTASDITQEVVLQNKLYSQNEELRAQEEELKQNLEELESLQESISARELKLNNILNAINNTLGSYEMHPDGTIINCNQEYSRLLGTESSEIKQKTHKQLLKDTSFDKEEYEMMWENFQGGIPYSMTILYVVNDKSIYLLESYNPILNNGVLESVFVLATDISETKTIELKLKEGNEELKAQEEELRQNLEEQKTLHEDIAEREAVLSNTMKAIDNTMGSFEMSIDGSILSANSEYLRIIKKTKDDIIGKKHRKLAKIDEYSVDEYEMMFENFTGGLPYSLQVNYKFDDYQVWLQESYTPIEEKGNFFKVLVLVNDITEIKMMEIKIKSYNEELLATEEELRQNLEELQAVQDNLAIRELELSNTLSAINNTFGSYEIDLNGTILSANDEFLTLIRKNYNEISGKKHKEIINQANIETDVYEMMFQNFEGGLPFSMKINYLTDFGNVWLHESYTPIKSGGAYTKVLVLVVDISEAKNLELNLKTSNEELQAQEEELKQNLEELISVQENLAVRELQLRNTMEAINNSIGSYEMDLEGKINKVNIPFLQMLNLKKDQIIGEKHIFLISLESIDKEEYSMMWENFKGGLSYENDVMYKTSKGEIWLHESYTPVLNEDNKYKNILVFVTDITEAKTKEIELKQNAKILNDNLSKLKTIQDDLETKEAELTSAIEAIGFSTFIAEYNLQGEVLEMNDAYLKLFKKQRRLMQGKNIREFSNLKGDDFEAFWDKVISGSIEKNIFNISFENKTHWLSEIYAPILDKNNKPEKILTIAFDITENKEHQIILQNQSNELEKINFELEKLSVVVRETSNAVLIMDAYGNFEWINEGSKKLYGYSLEELLDFGNNIQNLTRHQDIRKYIFNCREFKQAITYESESYSKDGKQLWTQTNLFPVLDNSGKVNKIVAIDTDITKIKEAENEITLRNKQISEQKQLIEQRLLEIQIQSEKLEKQNSIIENQNENIKSSIRYAQTIQHAILPPEELIKEYFDCFVIFKPRDIVSGDFYWFLPIKNKNGEYQNMSFIAVIDCTGHGVPGAFMSLIGYQLLNELILERRIFDLPSILNSLDEGIKKSLKQDQNINHDGMDISLCLISKKNENKYTCKFAGAKQAILYYNSKKSSIERYVSTKKSIGGIQKHNSDISFSETEFELSKNDIIYMPTDGIIDQNRKDRKRYGTQRLMNILDKFSHLPMEKQKEKILIDLADFQQNEEQRDDITFIAVKMK